MKNKKVFISGGSGVIGKELVSLLIKEKAKIFVGDLKPLPTEFKGKIKYRQGDLNYITREEIESFDPEIYFHLAATFERSEESYEFWEENFQNNLKLSHHLLKLIKDLKSIKKIIFASSYLIYDPSIYQFKKHKDNPKSLKESDAIYPRNLTGVAKLSHEIDLRFLNQFKNKKYKTISARIYRGYGCNSRDIISRWIRDLLDKKPISIYREEGIFDYIYAADSAKGLLKLSNTKDFSGVVNLGTGRGRKVKDILKILKKYFPDMKMIRKDSEINFEASQADIDLLKKETNWVPEYDLEKAIPLIIDFEKQRKISSKIIVQELNVLITSSGKKIQLIKAMETALNKLDKKYSLICGDFDENCIAKFFCDYFWHMPKTNEENFEIIFSKLTEKKINIILPTRDGELEFWSSNYNRFKEKGINVIISPFKSIKICLDKLAFYKFGLSSKFNFVKTSKNISFIDSDKFVVKEQFGSGSNSLGLNLSKQEAIKHSKELKNPIFQPYIEGREISIDSWLDDCHKVKGLILRSRDLVINGESKITTTFNDSEIEKDAIKILESLHLRGPVVLQAIIKDGQLFFLECNTRFGGGSTTSIRAGLDSLYWSILETQGENLNEYKFNKSISKVQKIRFEEDIFLNL